MRKFRNYLIKFLLCTHLYIFVSFVFTFRGRALWYKSISKSQSTTRSWNLRKLSIDHHQHHSEDTSTQSESNSFGEDYPRPGDDQTVILNRTHEDRSWEMRFQIQFKSASPSWNTTTRSHLPLILIEAGQLGTVTPHVYVVSSSDTYGSVSA